MAGRDAGRCHDVVAAGLRARHVYLYEGALVLDNDSLSAKFIMFAKSNGLFTTRRPGESRGSEHIEKTGFRPLLAQGVNL